METRGHFLTQRGQVQHSAHQDGWSFTRYHNSGTTKDGGLRIKPNTLSALCRNCCKGIYLAKIFQFHGSKKNFGPWSGGVPPPCISITMSPTQHHSFTACVEAIMQFCATFAFLTFAIALHRLCINCITSLTGSIVPSIR